ncbi:PKD domain-containing protein [Agriterribacter sp.]|uniref:PKD domain-containing protein n=1 Tax=Agriterribacter sp. TaxID=2821509 RepID=UPI002BBFF048|nr:PKD domain-containing protein [Agriterribacter sp.]HTN06525.1 PKD domain-containing protein [Agriterribacter sp.]
MRDFRLSLLLLLFTAPLCVCGQFRNIYSDPDPTNQIQGIHFISAKEGYVISKNWMGYTQDSGHTFIKKYITASNVDFNGYYVNLTFGFNPSGIHAFNKDTLIIYGDYGFVPAILVSSNQGNSFKLIYHSTLKLSIDNNGIESMCFPENAEIGYAVERNRILKSINRGKTWSIIFNDPDGRLYDIDFITNSTGYAISENKLLKTETGGNSWNQLDIPGDNLRSASFISDQKGWANMDGKIYYTADGGNSWNNQSNEFEHANKPIKFINDSVGYFIGNFYNIYRTDDRGKRWEPLPRNNAFSYNGLGHNKLFILNQSIIWAGGAHGFLELSTNGGGISMPIAHFKADLSELIGNNKVILRNYSKPGNQYRWFKNSKLLDTTYDASYLADRQSIDTVMLIVMKGSTSDTSEKVLIDTRINTQRCYAAFQAQIDTSSVRFIAGYNTPGVNHYWEFGDGETNNSDTNPLHQYKTAGEYTITHKVFNTIDKCRDSVSYKIIVYRTQNCISADFTYVADSFYTNKLTFTSHYDKTKEFDAYAMHVTGWEWGDGSTEYNLTHIFDSSQYYKVCMTVKNEKTGCIDKVCKPVFIEIEKGCNAEFKYDVYYGGGMHAEIKPHTPSATRKNIWIINDWDTINTGNKNYFDKSFAVPKEEWGLYIPSWQGGSCGRSSLEIGIDSLNKSIKHIVYDSKTNCADTMQKNIRIKRRREVYIKDVPNPNFPQAVSFYAYELNLSGDTIPYYSPGWRIEGPGGTTYFGGGNGSWQFNYTFPYSQRVKISIPNDECPSNQPREIYYSHFDIVADPCPIFPPDFEYKIQEEDSLSILFTDVTLITNKQFNNVVLWIFGDGDSSMLNAPIHTYKKPGSYEVILRYKNVNGCTKEKRKQVTITPPCTIYSRFSLTRDAIVPAKIKFINKSTSTTPSTKHMWFFGNGDSSSAKDPEYFYKIAGTYEVKLRSRESIICESWYDTTIIVTKTDICNISPEFKMFFTNNYIQFEDITTPANSIYMKYWNFGDGTSDSSASPLYEYKASGIYNICLNIVRDSICSAEICDSVSISIPSRKGVELFPNPSNSNISVRFSASEIKPIYISLLNYQGKTLKKIHLNSLNGPNEYKFDIVDLPKGNYLIQVLGLDKPLSNKFIKL